MTKHTPGPWYADPSKRVTGFAVTHDGEPNPLAIALRKPANSYSKGISDIKALANARLIAAAPDLLEALSNLFSVYAKPDQLICCSGHGCGCMGASVYQEAEHYANAAIAKARGEA